MEKNYSKIIGGAVFLEDEERPLTTVKDLVIEPATGKIAAFVVDINKNMVVAPVDVIEWNSKLVINGHDAIVPGEEIMRVKSAQESGIYYYRSKVSTEEGKYLGKVFDFTVDPGAMSLNSLYVAKDILGLVRYEMRIISMKHVIDVKREGIVVKEDALVRTGAYVVG